MTREIAQAFVAASRSLTGIGREMKEFREDWMTTDVLESKRLLTAELPAQRRLPRLQQQSLRPGGVATISSTLASSDFVELSFR